MMEMFRKAPQLSEGMVSAALEQHAQQQGHNCCWKLNLVPKWTNVNLTLLTQKQSLLCNSILN